MQIIEEAVKRIEEHKLAVKRNVLLNSHDYNLDRAVEEALIPFDVCIGILNSLKDENRVI